jgi:hypothetical protein
LRRTQNAAVAVVLATLALLAAPAVDARTTRPEETRRDRVLLRHPDGRNLLAVTGDLAPAEGAMMYSHVPLQTTARRQVLGKVADLSLRARRITFTGVSGSLRIDFYWMTVRSRL